MSRLFRFAALTLICGAAQAETFVVTRFDDPVPDTCTSQDCSLREAAIAATQNDPAGPVDRIDLAVGAYALTRGTLPVAPQGIEVVGAALDQTFLRSATTLFASNGPLTLRHLALQSLDGNVLDGRKRTLDNVRIPKALGAYPAGKLLFAGADLDITIRNSVLQGFFSCHGAGACAITDSEMVHFQAYSYAGSSLDVQIKGSRIEKAVNPDHYSYLTVAEGHTGRITIEDTTIAGGHVAVNSPGTTLTFRRVRYLENTGPVKTTAAAQVIVEDSEFRGNTDRAVLADGGAEWLVERSSFIGNRTHRDAGGAVFITGNADMTILNSTFSGNTFTVEAAGNGAHGAAIGWDGVNGASLYLAHVTAVSPTFLPAGILGTLIGGEGGGIDLIANNSILRGTCHLDPGASWGGGTFGNIESPGHSCGLQAGLNLADVTASALALGELGNHGGFAPTYAPGEGSIAVDLPQASAGLPADQRGHGRPFGNGYDAGAIEAGDNVFADDFE